MTLIARLIIAKSEPLRFEELYEARLSVYTVGHHFRNLAVSHLLVEDHMESRISRVVLVTKLPVRTMHKTVVLTAHYYRSSIELNLI